MRRTNLPRNRRAIRRVDRLWERNALHPHRSGAIPRLLRETSKRLSCVLLRRAFV